MKDLDFEVPDVVWIDKVDLVQFSEYDDHVSDADLYLNPRDGDSYSFTLTTTAEENTRKAVNDVLSRIEEALDADYWWDEPIQARELIEQLRREYQQPKATE